jgi:DNA-binding transcriptional LysR family regulator
MTLEQLRVFIAVAGRLHVTNAPRALDISQSSASAANATLFDRIGRRVELTEAGRAAVEAGTRGASISNLLVRNSLAAGRLARLPFSLRARGFHALCHGERVQSRAVTALLDMTKKGTAA